MESTKKRTIVWIIITVLLLIIAIFFARQYTDLINRLNEEARRTVDLSSFAKKYELYQVGDIDLDLRSEEEAVYEFGLDPDSFSQIVWYASDKCRDQILLLECENSEAEIQAISKLVRYQEYEYGEPYYRDIYTKHYYKDYVFFIYAGGSVAEEMFQNNFIYAYIYLD